MANELGVAFLTTGFDPKWAVKEVPIMPKDRYRCAACLPMGNYTDMHVEKKMIHNHYVQSYT